MSPTITVPWRGLLATVQMDRDGFLAVLRLEVDDLENWPDGPPDPDLLTTDEEYDLWLLALETAGDR